MNKVNLIRCGVGEFCGMANDRKPLRETKVGKWVAEKFPDVIEVIGDALPEKGVLGILKNLIDGKSMTSAERLQFEQLYSSELIEIEREITKRWEADAKSQFMLPQITRPLIVLALVAGLLTFITLDSLEVRFSIAPHWVAMYEVVLIAAIGGYFSARTIDKRNQNKYSA